ncbi:hypothetical protein N9M21_03575 [Alphaproteobacteria bacterium]|nr:hypothetical protein [Alphaproteobacteria bacterium]
MNVFKFIVGFIGGLIGTWGGGFILYEAVFMPRARMGGVEGYDDVLWIPAGLSAGFAVYIGGGFTPRVWKWGLRLGFVIPAALIVPSTLEAILRL